MTDPPPLRQRRRRRPPPAPTLASPLRILSQIAALQLAYYAGAAIMLLFTALVAGEAFSLDLLLSWRVVRGDTAAGWTLGLCWMLASAYGAILLLLLIARSKLVPDFALTLHGLHLLATSLYARALPTGVFWWGLQLASAALMTFLGVWACQWRELRPLSFGGAAATGPKAKMTPALAPGVGPGHEDEEDGDEEEVETGAQNGGGLGLSRMWGALRGKDGGKGEYEMVGMKPRDAG